MFLNSVIPESESPGSQAFFKIVSNYLEQDFPALDGLRIVFSFVEPSRFDGQVPIPVKAYKYSPPIRDVFEKDFHVEISREAWQEASRAQRLIIVYRGLCFLGVDLDEGGVPKVDAVGRIMTRLLNPDIEASRFSSEILKFGADASLKALTKTLQHLVDRTSDASQLEK